MVMHHLAKVNYAGSNPVLCSRHEKSWIVDAPSYEAEMAKVIMGAICTIGLEAGRQPSKLNRRGQYSYGALSGCSCCLRVWAFQ